MVSAPSFCIQISDLLYLTLQNKDFDLVELVMKEVMDSLQNYAGAVTKDYEIRKRKHLTTQDTSYRYLRRLIYLHPNFVYTK